MSEYKYVLISQEPYEAQRLTLKISGNNNSKKA